MKALYPAWVLLALSQPVLAAPLSPADRSSIEQQQQQLAKQQAEIKAQQEQQLHLQQQYQHFLLQMLTLKQPFQEDLYQLLLKWHLLQNLKY